MWKRDFDEFCSGLGGLSYVDMIRAVEKADGEVQRASAGRRRGAPAARAAGADEFVARAGRLLFWLRHGVLPDGRTGKDLAIYRTLATRLVERGEFKPDALAPFDHLR